MNRGTSLYLDLVRFLAALAVFFAHACSSRWSGGLFWQIAPLGSEAVVIFFVLSGFVIGYAADERERSAKTYAISRMARIYSVAVPALVLTFILDEIGRSVNPGLYVPFPGSDYVSGQVVWQFFNAIIFTNQVWFNHVQPGMDGPYWSLGYEIPYYVAFGLGFFGPRWCRYFAPAVVMLIAGPKIASLFPMWLLGLGAYRLCVKRPLGRKAGLSLWIVSCAALAAVLAPLHHHHGLYEELDLSVSRLQDVLHFYLVAVLFAANVVGFRGAAPLIGPLLDRAFLPIRLAGQTTFALYLFHMPIIQFVVALAPWPAASWPTRGLVFIGVPVIVFGLAEITERRKDSWRRAFEWLLRSPPRPRLAP